MTGNLLMITIGLSPNLLHVGGLTVTWHSLVTVASIGLAVFLISRWAEHEGLHKGIVPDIAPWAILGGLIGARVLYILDNWGFFFAHPSQIVAVWSGGIAVFGAIAGGAVAGTLYSLSKKYPVRRSLDISAPALIVAQGVGRLGDLINGEHFSSLSTLPWAVRYTDPRSPAFGMPPQHPAVAYEMLADLALFGVLWLLRGRMKPDGSLFLVYAMLYAVIRLPLSLLRQDSASAALGLNQQGWAAVFVLTGALLLWIKLKPQVNWLRTAMPQAAEIR